MTTATKDKPFTVIAEQHRTGCTVRVPACRMHADVPGVIVICCVLRESGSLPIVDYWIEFEDGELCLHPHADVEMVAQADIGFGQCVEPTDGLDSLEVQIHPYARQGVEMAGTVI